MYTPAQVAKRANVHPNTIRKWASEYAELLSSSASGEAGARLLTDEDVQVFCAIAVLRKSGMPRAEVIARIRDGIAPEVVDITLHESPQEALQVPQVIEDSQPATQLVYIALQSRVEALERRADRDASQLVTGIVIGAAITLVVVALVLRVV